ncbi:MAG: sigma 54-interacting transcriptional regulator [Candidatus Krumholzibacteriia bacterium]
MNSQNDIGQAAYEWQRRPIPSSVYDSAWESYCYEQYDQVIKSIDLIPDTCNERLVSRWTRRDAVLLRASAMSRSGDPTRCIDYLDRLAAARHIDVEDIDFMVPRLRSELLLERYSYVADVSTDYISRLLDPLDSKIADYLYLRSLATYGSGHTEQAMCDSEASYAINRLVGREIEACEAANHLGRVYLAIAKYGPSELWFRRAAAMAEQIGGPRRIGHTRLNLGVVFYKAGKLASARDSLLSAVRAYSRVESDIELCNTHIALGNVHRLMREFEEARKYLMRAYTEATELKIQREECLALEFLGDVYRDEERPEEARRYYARGMAIARNIAPDGDLVMELMRREGECLMLGGAVKKALEPMQDARARAKKIGDRFEEGVTLRCLAEAARALGDLLAARRYVDEGISLLTAIDARHELAVAHLAAAEIAFETARGEVRDARAAEGNLRALAAVAGAGAGAGARAGAGAGAGPGADLRAPGSDRPAVAAGSARTGEWTRPSEIDVGHAEALQHLDRGWQHAVTAEHLCQRVGVTYWTARAQRLLATIARRRVEELRRLKESRRGDEEQQVIIAVSPAMKEVLHLCDAFAPYDEAVLITGATGVGKELVARRVHASSLRKDRPFVAVNAAAIPQTMFEREFFGHVKGAFSGADRDQPGYAALANGGTLFLDEIGEMAPETQVKLLRLLQYGTYQALGSPEDRHADIRLIAATNAPLRRLVEEGRFRSDLYYRLRILEIDVPPLSERREDIVPLLEYFLSLGAGRAVRAAEYFNHASLRLIKQYPWPGNAREVATVARRAQIGLSGEGKVAVELGRPPDAVVLSGPGARTATASVATGGSARRTGGQAAVTRGELVMALEDCDGNRTRAAQRLGIGRATIYRLLKRYGLQRI